MAFEDSVKRAKKILRANQSTENPVTFVFRKYPWIKYLYKIKQDPELNTMTDNLWKKWAHSPKGMEFRTTRMNLPSGTEPEGAGFVKIDKYYYKPGSRALFNNRGKKITKIPKEIEDKLREADIGYVSKRGKKLVGKAIVAPAPAA